MKLMNFSDNARKVFGSEENLKATVTAIHDLANGVNVFTDSEGNEISKRDAEDSVRRMMWSILGLNEETVKSKKNRKRALKRDEALDFYQIIEDESNFKVTVGLQDNEIFNEFVDRRSIADGDEIDFYVEDDTLLSIAKVSGQHHDFVLQRLGRGNIYNVPTSVYGGAVGYSIDRYLVGQEDIETLINAISSAFTKKILDEVYAQISNLPNTIPLRADLVGSGTLVKADLDAIIEKVAASNNSDVVIVGTKLALKNLNALTDVNWRSLSQKESVAATGRLGTYEGTDLIELPQRYADKNLQNAIINDDLLLILPAVDDNKFIKVVDSGEIEIDEITEKGEANGRIDDIGKYEIQREFGVGVVFGRNFGAWEI